MQDGLKVSPGPHISKHHSTRSVMADVIIAMIPAMIMAGVYFRLRALLLIGTCVITCIISEWLCNVIRKKPNSLGDLSAVITGIILAFSVPPQLPLWAAVIGSAFAVMIGKMVFGGLGSNIFNPAMVGRCFLTLSFGVMMTTWTAPATAWPITDGVTQATTQATPLARSKEAIKANGQGEKNADVVNRELKYMFFGSTGGCLGETSAIALLIGAAYLLIRRTISWHIPAAVLISAFICAQIGYFINPQAYILPIAHLFSGGMLLGAFFIATDPVTAPLTKRGMWIFGAGVGVVTMLIRIVGEYPEGVMFSILLMNALTPLIDRFCKLTPAGGKPNA